MKRAFPADLRRVVLAITLIGCGFLVSACPSVKHITVLRDAQQAFSAASTTLNERTSEALAGASIEAPALSTIEAAPSGKEPVNLTQLLPLSNTTIHDLSVRFADVARRLAALNENEASALQQDKLYGTSLVLQATAEWKAALLAHLAGEVAIAESGTADGKVPEPPSFRELRERIQAVKRAVKAEETPLFARDEAMLAAYEPMLRYDNAYVSAVRYARENRFSGDRPYEERSATVRSIVEEMAQAETELADLKLQKPAAHLSQYIIVSRFIMLRTAYKLMAATKVDRQEKGASFDSAGARGRFPKLVPRLEKMKSEALARDSALCKALRQEENEDWPAYLDKELLFWK